MQKLTPYPDIDKLLHLLRDRIQQILSEKLVGLYLYGSLVTGDFDPGVSDVDLLAATTDEIDDEAFRRLQRMHLDFVTEHPAWENRIEIAYLPVEGLRTFRTQESVMVVISPGEPLHRKPAGKEWTINWWLVRERGRTLYGPDPKTLIEPVSRQEFLSAVREHARHWREWVKESRSRKGQSYARLTLCRALYAAVYGEQTSKRRAALWAQDRYPTQARLIEEALEWREAEDDSEVDQEATFPETERFVRFMVDQVEAASDMR
jgi:predicted nucleotidyltransferase